jgi:hypothetical protein
MNGQAANCVAPLTLLCRDIFRQTYHL